MPCNNGGYEDPRFRKKPIIIGDDEDDEEEDDDEDEEPRESRIDKVTRLLCELCKTVERKESIRKKKIMSPELRLWWTEHKKLDAARRHKEMKEAKVALRKAAYKIKQLEDEGRE